MTHFTQDNIKSAFDLSDAAFDGLRTYHSLLIKWQKAINLVSRKTLDEAWHRHFADSAQLARLILEDENKRLYADLGCGAGFPGLVVAIMRPDLDVHLVESDKRKGQFVRMVVRETGLPNVTIHMQRIEDVTGAFVPDYISARALAPLSVLLDYCRLWLEVNPDMRFYFLKGARVDQEIDEARAFCDFNVSIVPSVTDGRARIVSLNQVVFTR